MTSMTMFNRFRISSDLRAIVLQSIRANRTGCLPGEDILRNREIRAEVDLLVYRVDSELLRCKRRIRAYAFAFQHDLPGILLMHSGENLDQRGLSGAILAHDCVDLSLEKAEVNAGKGLHAWK